MTDPDPAEGLTQETPVPVEDKYCPEVPTDAEPTAYKGPCKNVVPLTLPKLIFPPNLFNASVCLTKLLVVWNASISVVPAELFGLINTVFVRLVAFAVKPFAVEVPDVVTSLLN